MQNKQKMLPKEALNLLAQVASMYKGTLQEHTALQEAVSVINEVVESAEKDAETEQ